VQQRKTSSVDSVKVVACGGQLEGRTGQPGETLARLVSARGDREGLAVWHQRDVDKAILGL
jgi:hypothetical protein